MRWGVIALAMLAIGCSKVEPDNQREGAKVSEDRGPNVGVAQTPGVALSYQYGFRLPVERVASVQEEHATQCEALTPTRCRISGMTYNVSRNRMITASLQLKLAPEIARRFGKQGVDTVVKRGGMLADASIQSEEAGATIAAVDSDQAAIDSERGQITNQLSKPGLSSSERTQLQARLAELSNEHRQSQGTRGEAALKLASTPMTFNYESGDVDPGLSDGPIVGAIKDGWANIIMGFATILTILITLIPWLATAGLVIWLWRRFGARLGLRHNPKDD
jgi:hypothetical protein